MHEMNSHVTGVFIASLQSPEYTLNEKFRTWTAKARAGVAIMWNDMLATDLRTKVIKLDIPIYFFEGIYDYTCNYSLAKDYFEKIDAPVKGFYTFEESAHSPIFEEPKKVQKILREDVLRGTNKLADR